jgi:hypothetical protein
MQSYQFNGSGSSNTAAFALGTGKLRISWSVSHDSGSAAEQQYNQRMHQINVDYIEDTYRIWEKYYQDLINRAVDERDAMALLDAKRQLGYWQNWRAEELSKENADYQSKSSGASSGFKLKIARVSGGSKTLVKGGEQSGSVVYQVSEGNDYFLSIVADGNWNVSITPVQ